MISTEQKIGDTLAAIALGATDALIKEAIENNESEITIGMKIEWEGNTADVVVKKIHSDEKREDFLSVNTFKLNY